MGMSDGSVLKLTKKDGLPVTFNPFKIQAVYKSKIGDEEEVVVHAGHTWWVVSETFEQVINAWQSML